MLNKITEIIKAANPSYTVIYEEKHMMNVRADELQRNAGFAYIEEFIRGRYQQERYRPASKTMQMQIYFSRFADMHADAMTREALRTQIETEIILPFMKQYEKSAYFNPVDAWNIYYPFPRWDANEVSVMLEFGCKVQVC
jgi:hypothetical protein